MQDKIIDFLKKKDGYLSGDHISQRLGVSRQALWKHIQELKEAGYDIIAVPHLGYKLISCPDRLFPQEISRHLNTKFIGRKIHYFDSAQSTMDLAVESGIKGAPEGTVIVAETQTKGRGRLGRGWFSPKYKGLYLSLILRPNILPNQSPILTLLAAVSICEAIKETAGLETQIKWPNDILIHGKKAGGILTELNAETDEIRFLVIGIGLNVNSDTKTLPAGSTSLKEQLEENVHPVRNITFSGKKNKISNGVNRVELLQEILRKIEDNYYLFHKRSSAPIIDKWREYGVTLGKRIKVTSHKEHIEGIAVDIDIDGGLLVRKDSGVTQKVMAGDVVHCR